MITVLLVDDQPAVRQGLAMRLALEPDVQVIGAAASGAEALTLAARLQPDVVLMDVEMPDLDGIATTRQMRRELPACRVVMLSIYDDLATRRRATDAGAAAFVAKQEPTEVLLATIRAAPT